VNNRLDVRENGEHALDFANISISANASTTIASHYYNCSSDGSISPRNYGYTLICMEPTLYGAGLLLRCNFLMKFQVISIVFLFLS
jgi:hypothetical protein